MCPISQREMNGSHGFSYLKPCGHTFSTSALKEISDSKCLLCSKPYESSIDMIPINPTDSIEIERLRQLMENEKLKEKLAKKEKKKARKLEQLMKSEKEEGEEGEDGDKLTNGTHKKKSKTSSSTTATTTTTTSMNTNTTLSKNSNITLPKGIDIPKHLKIESEAIKSIYRSKDKSKKNEGTWMTRGTFTRYA